MGGEVAERLAAFALDARPGAAALEVMRLSLLDWAACGLAGRDEPVAQILRAAMAAEGGTGQASALGMPGRWPARAAALVNGATAHALDYDDTHFAHIGHPSVAVVPAVLAVAEATGAQGPAMLAAALVGAEASVRVGLWLGRAHYQTGFHQTATAGAFGAALGCARLMGLDRAHTLAALGLTATRASGLKSQFGTMGKPYNAGIAAANGVETATLARAGLGSSVQALDGVQGFGPTHAGAADPEALEGLGDVWLMESVSHKFHACCHGLHAMLEAIAELGRVELAAVEGLEVRVHPRWLRVCDIAAPRTGLEAKFSYRLTAAMKLAGHDTGALDTFSDASCTDAALVAVRDRVSVVAEPDMAETAAEVALRLRGGEVRRASHDLLGRMPAREKARRLRDKAGALLGARDADALWAAVQDGPDLARLTAMLRG